MKLPWLAPALGALLGAVLAPLVTLPGILLLAASIPISALLWELRGHRLFPPILTVLFILLTVVRAGEVSRRHLKIPLNAPAGNIHLKGVVASPPDIREGTGRSRVSFLLKTTGVYILNGDVYKEEAVTGTVQVLLYGLKDIPLWGEEVIVSGKLKVPERALNPFDFDYEGYLKSLGANSVLTGYGWGSIQCSGTRSLTGHMLSQIDKLRGKARKKIKRLWDTRAGFFSALILGNKSGLSGEDKRLFAQTGTAHLFSISGLHIGLVSASLYLVMIFCGARRKASALAGIYAVIFYVFFSGAGLPVRRAGVMICLIYASLLMERPYRAMNLLSLCVFLFLFTFPQAVRSVSFQLSFGAVFSLILFSSFCPWVKPLWNSGGQTVVVMAGLFPLLAHYFYIFPVFSFFANLLAVPLFYLALVFAILALMIPEVLYLPHIPALTADFFLRAAMKWISFLNEMPYSSAVVRRPESWQHLFYYGALSLLLLAFYRYDKENKKRPLVAKAGLIGAFGCYVLVAATFFFPLPGHQSNMQILAAKNGIHLFLNFKSGRHWIITSPELALSDIRWVLPDNLKGQGISKIEGVITGARSRAQSFSSFPNVRAPLYLLRLPEEGQREKGLLYPGSYIKTGSGEIRVIGSQGRRPSILVDMSGLRVLWVADPSRDFFEHLETDIGDTRPQMMIVPVGQPSETALAMAARFCQMYGVRTLVFRRESHDVSLLKRAYPQVEFYSIEQKGAMKLKTGDLRGPVLPVLSGRAGGLTP